MAVVRPAGGSDIHGLALHVGSNLLPNLPEGRQVDRPPQDILKVGLGAKVEPPARG